MTRAAPIAVFDSGVGGLSVFREIVQLLPGEDILYFADTVHCPYGSRPLAEIQRFSSGIVEFLAGQVAKIIVVACNTASAAALQYLRGRFNLPIVGMEPAVKPAAERTKSGVIGVLATPATFQGELFASLLDRFAQGVKVLPQVCPGLVEQVEAGKLDGADTESMLRQYIDPLLQQGADQLVLGCTHYPFLIPAMQRIAGDGVEIIDPSPAVARRMKTVLAEKGLLNPRGGGGQYAFYTTGEVEIFKAMLARLVGPEGSIQQPRWEEREGRLIL